MKKFTQAICICALLTVTAFGADKFHGFLGGEQQAQDVEIEVVVEKFLGDALERGELVDGDIAIEKLRHRRAERLKPRG